MKNMKKEMSLCWRWQYFNGGSTNEWERYCLLVSGW